MIWTKPYLGITYAGNLKVNEYWVSVEKRSENFYSCSMFFPGCKFSPRVERFNDEASAKAAGEKFLNEHAL